MFLAWLSPNLHENRMMRGTVSNQNTSRRYDVMASCFDFGLLFPCFRLDFLQTHTKHGWYIQYFSKLSESTQYLVEIEHLGYGPEVALMPIFEVEKNFWTQHPNSELCFWNAHLWALGHICINLEIIPQAKSKNLGKDFYLLMAENRSDLRSLRFFWNITVVFD